MSFEMAAIGEMGHLLGEFGEASNLEFKKGSKGNNICFVHNKDKLPLANEMEPNTLYVYKEGDDIRVSGQKRGLTSYTKKDIILKFDSSNIEEIESKKRLNSLLENPSLMKSPELGDIKLLINKSKEVVSRTYRQAAIDSVTSIGSALIKAKENLEKIPVLGRVGKETMAAAVTVVNISITAAFGSEKNIPFYKDTLVRKAASKFSNATGLLWKKAKQNIPVLEYVDQVIEIKNKVTNSKFVGQALSVGFGVAAALAVGTGVAFSAPISIPLIAASSAGIVATGALADQRRKKAKTEKARLEDLIVGISNKQEALEKLKQNNKDITKILGIKEEKLREIPKPETTMLRVVETYPVKKIAELGVSNAALIAVKSMEAASNPMGVGLQAGAFAISSASGIANMVTEANAKHILKKQIEALEKVAPEGAIEHKHQLAQNAYKTLIESKALDLLAQDKEINKPGVSEEALKKKFAEYQRQARQEVDTDKSYAKRYTEYQLTPPSERSMASKVYHKTTEFMKHTANYLFSEKASYREALHNNPEAQALVIKNSEFKRNQTSQEVPNYEIAKDPKNLPLRMVLKGSKINNILSVEVPFSPEIIAQKNRTLVRGE